MNNAKKKARVEAIAAHLLAPLWVALEAHDPDRLAREAVDLAEALVDELDHRYPLAPEGGAR